MQLLSVQIITFTNTDSESESDVTPTTPVKHKTTPVSAHSGPGELLFHNSSILSKPVFITKEIELSFIQKWIDHCPIAALTFNLEQLFIS